MVPKTLNPHCIYWLIVYFSYYLGKYIIYFLNDIIVHKTITIERWHLLYFFKAFGPVCLSDWITSKLWFTSYYLSLEMASLYGVLGFDFTDL